VVFALGLASHDFKSLLPTTWGHEIRGILIALPIVWAYVISNIFSGWLGSREQ
jgi:hypothetical protein